MKFAVQLIDSTMFVANGFTAIHMKLDHILIIANRIDDGRLPQAMPRSL
jgi:hypothetical protein